ncbi:unnamed protein product [Malus baccata var. baccata]
MSDSMKIEGLLRMLTVKLQDDNFVKWSYQFQSVLRGYDMFNYFTSESPCSPRFVIDTETGVTKEVIVAYKNWVKKDLALLSLLIVTLFDDVMGIKDQLISAGEKVTENDYMIVVLSGLPVDFEMIKILILTREIAIVEASIETRMHSLSSYVAAMMVQGEGSNSQRFQGGYEYGENSNSNGDQSFQQRNDGHNNYFGNNNYSGNNRRFNNGNNNSKLYSSNYGNRSENSSDGNGSSNYFRNGK